MIDLKLICDDLALRFVAATIGTPSGADAMRGASGQMPKQVAVTPYTYIEPTDGSVVANDRWEHTISLDSVTLFGKRPGDPVRVEKQRQAWLGYLLAATEGKLKLGVTGQTNWELAKAIPTTWKWDEVDVGAETHDAIRVTWLISVYETVNLVP